MIFCVKLGKSRDHLTRSDAPIRQEEMDGLVYVCENLRICQGCVERVCGFDNQPLHDAEGANDFARVPKILGLGTILDPDPCLSVSVIPNVIFFSVEVAVVVMSSSVRVSSRVLPSVPTGPRGGSSVPTMLNDSTPSACIRA